ncbi:MAG: hypothetical protein HRU09_20125 [Oligoflexales bacterium]|nr:hypothetical protein [Oligoflexales bacterium]
MMSKVIKGKFGTTVPNFGRWTDLPRDYNLSHAFLQRHAENDYKVTANDSIKFVKENNITAFVLCNPNNPIGQALPKEESFICCMS